MNYAFYEASGRIKLTLTAPNEGIAQLQGGDFLVTDDEVLPDTHYVDVVSKKILPKKEIDLSYSEEGDLGITFTHLPEGLLVESLGSSVRTDQDDLYITYDLTGTYRIRFSDLLEFRDTEMEVTVGDP